MTKRFYSLLMLVAISSFPFLSSCDKDDDNMEKPDIVFYGLSSINQLVKYNVNASQTPISTTAITGLSGGEKIIAIDFRPATGQLYGLGNSSRLYIINYENGAATQVSAFPNAARGFAVGLGF